MMGRALASDLLKIRRKGIWFLIWLGPIGVVGLQAANFGLRYDYLTKHYAADLWLGLLQNIHSLLTLTIMMGITLISSMIAGIEHQMNSWKQFLALPLSKVSVYAAKFLLCVILLTVSSLLLIVGTAGLGVVLGFGWKIPLLDIMRISLYSLVASLPILALQLWLSLTIKNQAIPLTVGILGTVITLFAFAIPDWMPWKWPLLINEANQPEYSVAAGLTVGAVVFLIGMIDFVRRDVK